MLLFMKSAGNCKDQEVKDSKTKVEEDDIEVNVHTRNIRDKEEVPAFSPSYRGMQSIIAIDYWLARDREMRMIVQSQGYGYVDRISYALKWMKGWENHNQIT